jgi:hypothetical protein
MNSGRMNGLERVKDQLTRCIACTECYGRGLNSLRGQRRFGV